MLNKSTKDIKYMIGHTKTPQKSILLKYSFDYHENSAKLTTTDNKTMDVKWTKLDGQHYQQHIVDKIVHSN